MHGKRSAISNHNNRLLERTPVQTQRRNCNCRIPGQCLLRGNCWAKNIAYKAEVTTTEESEMKQCIGMTANTFKERYGNHKKSISKVDYCNKTELSNHVYKLKMNGKYFQIKWSIIKHAAAFVSASRRTCA